MGLGKHYVLLGASSGSLFTCFGSGSAAAANGTAWAFNIRKGVAAEPVEIPIQGYPDRTLHAHGIYVSNKTDRMYVINHLGPKSVVEVLKIEYNEACLNNDWACAYPVTLQYLSTVENPMLIQYGINDVVEGMDASEIYITRWRPFATPEHGERNPENILERVKVQLNVLFTVLGIPWTYVYRCQVESSNCEIASKSIFIGANGITVAPNRTTYYVADPLEKTITVLNRCPQGFLHFDSRIQVKGANFINIFKNKIIPHYTQAISFCKIITEKKDQIGNPVFVLGSLRSGQC